MEVVGKHNGIDKSIKRNKKKREGRGIRDRRRT